MKPVARLLLSAALITNAAFAQTPTSTVDDAHALAIGRAFLRYQEQLRAIQPANNDAQWWRGSPATSGPASSLAMREKMMKAEAEFFDAVQAATGINPISSYGRDSRYAFLPEAKQAAVVRIEQTFSLRAAEMRSATATSRLPSDYEKLRALGAERERALLVVLTPAEFETLELRTSPASNNLRSKYGEVIESEEEFRKLYALQKAFEDKFPNEAIVYSSNTSAALRARVDAERKLGDDIKAVVGPERFVVFQRAADPDYVMLKGLVRRLNLPAGTPDAVMELRDQYSKTSLGILMQAAVNPMDRRTLIQDLEKEAKQKLTEILGRDGAETYAGRALWLRYLSGGQAFTTDPSMSSGSISSNSGVYPVMVPPSVGGVIRTTLPSAGAAGTSVGPPPASSPASPGSDPNKP